MEALEILKKAVIPLTSAILGGAIVLIGLHLSPNLSQKLAVSSIPQEPEVTVSLKGIDDIISKQREIQNDRMKNPFDSWFSDKFGGGSIEGISSREDDKYVYYDIKVENLNLTSINTKVEKGHINIAGTVEKKDESENSNNFSSHSYFKSTFSRTFPLPDGVDASKMETVPEKDKIILKFPKLKI